MPSIFSLLPGPCKEQHMNSGELRHHDCKHTVEFCGRRIEALVSRREEVGVQGTG